MKFLDTQNEKEREAKEIGLNMEKNRIEEQQKVQEKNQRIQKLVQEAGQLSKL